jgi:hypothetical protein
MPLNWWMETRSKEGEKIHEDSWLMREDWSRKGLGFGAANPDNKTISADSIKKMLSTALREQGIRGKPRNTNTSGAVRYEFSTDHSLRKWFETKATQAGMNLLSAEMLMGHETGLSYIYIRPTESELLEEYLKVHTYTYSSNSATYQNKIDSFHLPKGVTTSLEALLNAIKFQQKYQ